MATGGVAGEFVVNRTQPLKRSPVPSSGDAAPTLTSINNNREKEILGSFMARRVG